MKNKIIFFVIVPSIIFSIGMLVGAYEHSTIKSLSNFIYPKQTSINWSSYIYEDNIQNLIHINNENDILKKRMELVDYIWPIGGFPSSKLPDSIEENITDDRYSNFENIEQIDKITVLMENNVTSIAYLFHPNQSNNKLVIYHQGHDGDFFKGRDTIQFFLNQDYSVLAFSMPLLGMNNQPVVETQFGKIKLTSHNDFQFLESEQFSPIKYFIEPITVSLNYVDEQFDFDKYVMVGISGGGWTVGLYSALDERISESYSVAGSFPMFLRSIPGNQGDYEQRLPTLYRITDYLDLYVMSSYGQDRKFVQIFNKYDPCCFSGEIYTTYYDEIKSRMNQLGKGEFEIFLDDTHHEHKISQHALEIIISSIDRSNID